MKIKEVNKKIILGLLFVFTFLTFGIFKINAAAGNFTLGFNGPSNVEVGNTISVQVVVKNMSEGVSGVGATLNYDSSFLELQDKTAGTVMAVSYNNDNPAKFMGVSMGSTVTTTSTIVTYKFKTLKEGSTSITLKEITSTNMSYQSMNVTPETYNVTIGPKKSTNANLGTLTVEGHTVTKVNNGSYTLSVGNDVTSVKVAATCADAKATISWPKGQAGVNNLNVGSNQIQVRCTAESGVGATYTLTVTRAGAPVVASSDNNLNNMSVSGYTISPAFNKDTLEYSVTIPNEADAIIVNTEKSDSKATVAINGATGLQVGENTVEVVVTAEDGSSKIYKIKVTREEKVEVPVEKDKDATLSKLNVSGYTLSPTFKPNINTYTMTVQSTVDGLKVDAIPTSSKATVEVSGNLNWQYGMNTITITVTAENGDKNTYTVNVNRKSPETKEEPKKSGDSYLTSLTVKGAELNPTFDKDRSSYEITVPYEVDKLDISFITSDKNAKVEVLDNEPLQVNKKQTIRIKVTAEDGSVREYTINATRSAMSSNTYLKELSAGDFLLTPLFDKETLNYKTTVKPGTKELNLTAIAENPNAKVEIFGNSDFKEGTNIVMIRVTDENGFNKIYQIEVEKLERSIFGMSVGQFLMMTFLGLGLLSLFLIMLLILKRSKKEEPTPVVAAAPQAPTIDFKPEFNFGSRNGTDDDVVYPGGVLNQGNGSMQNLPGNEPKKLVGTYSEANYTDVDEDEGAPFDYYDETITKAELIQAIKEGMETKNPEKLKMLMKQDELNQMKKEIKRKEAAKRKASRSRDYDE